MKEVRLFTASWCKKCKESDFLEVMESAKKQNSDWNFTTWDIDELEDKDDYDGEIPTKVPTVHIVIEGQNVEILNGKEEITGNIEMTLTAY
tara:strand:+ start:531 stop:803 length:273 start_codon:yes stop_codon:yes gene_type:complete